MFKVDMFKVKLKVTKDDKMVPNSINFSQLLRWPCLLPSLNRGFHGIKGHPETSKLSFFHL